MLNSLIGIVTCLGLVCLISRLVAWLIIWAARRFGQTSIKIGRFGFLAFGDVAITRGSFTIKIERLWLTSCYVNKEAKKPLSMCIYETRVEIDLGVAPRKSESKKTSKSLLRYVISALKIFGARLDNIHIVARGGILPDCLVHIAIQELLPDVHITSDRLSAVLHLNALSLKLLNTAQHASEDENQPCLGEVSLSQTVQAEMNLEDGISLELLHSTFDNPCVKLTEGLIGHMQSNLTQSSQNASHEEENEENEVRHSGRPVAARPSVISKLLAVLPEKFSLDLQDCEVHLAKEIAQRQLSLSIKTVQLDVLQNVDSLCSSADFKLSYLQFGSVQAHLANLNDFKTQIQVTEQRISLESFVNNAFVGYHHEEIQYWSHLLSRVRLKSPHQHRQHHNKTSLFGDYIKSRSLDFSLKARNISLAVAMATCSGIKNGMSSLDVSFHSAPVSSEGELTDARIEMEVSPMYSKLKEGGVPSSHLVDKMHHWNTLVYVGTLILKVNKFGHTLLTEMMLDSVQLEASTQSSAVLSQLTNALLGQLSPVSTPTDQQATLSPRPSSIKGLLLHANVQLTNFNVFITAQEQVCTMLRIDGVNVNHRPNESVWEISGVKALHMNHLPAALPICRSLELHTYMGHMRTCEIKYSTASQKCEVLLKEELYLVWSTNLHMCLHSTSSELMKVIHRIMHALKPCSLSVPSDPKPVSSLTLCVSVRGNIMAALSLSKGHRVTFSSPEVSWMRSKMQASFKTDQLSIMFDQHEIFKLQGVHVHSQHHSDQLRMERESHGTLSLSTNRAWIVSFEKILLTFPYKYQFAECFDEVKNLNKWRKMIHKVQKKPFDSNSLLPPDLVIRAKSVTVQLNDDPFEVKLGDHYKLRIDESVEKEKRESALDQRVQELRKKHGLLPAGKVEELHSALGMRSARVYIDRSQKLYATSPMRTRLFTWTLQKLEVISLADVSLHGKENCIKHMREIDAQSPYPDEDVDYVTLWCRLVNVSISAWTFQLRDFPTPMLDIHDFQLWGRLVGAEQRAIPRARRQCVVEVGAPWGDMKVDRNMPALKFYHDFSADMGQYTMAYGPCWEPSWAMFNLSMNFVNMASVDPSKPLPFWDKSRNLFHGRLTLLVQRMSWLYHVSLDPYNTTEFMDWTWTNLGLDWTNAKWVLKGDLDIYARTASKYDDCRFLHLPNLQFRIDLEWLCPGDPNDHHSVMPCAPDKLPEYSMEAHDSFRAFRSQKFNMTWSFQTQPCEDGDFPCCNLYASTLRWMDRMKMCMARVARPIKRGKIFKNLRPKKAQLTRHVRNFFFNVDFHKFAVIYWVSFAKQNGYEIAGERLKLQMGMQHSLVPWLGPLIRRPRTNWDVKSLSAELFNTTVWLQSHDKRKTFKGNLGVSTASQRSYFLGFDTVTYARDKDRNADEEADSEEGDCDYVPRHKVQVFGLKASWTINNRDVALTLYDSYNRASNLRKNLSAEALKGFKVEEESLQTPSKSKKTISPTGTLASGVSPSPLSKLQSGPAYCMLQKLVSESDSNFVAVHEELSSDGVQIEDLHGIRACQTSDVTLKNWHVELYNSQAMLKGSESEGYVVVSAAKASLLSCDHKPVWKNQQEVRSKMTLVGSIESMQYYATIEAQASDNIRWLAKEHIETVSEAAAGIDSMFGSGQCVGGVVTDVHDDQLSGPQLQRIISRCRCQFFYAGYGEIEDTDGTQVPPPPVSGNEDMMKLTHEGVDAFTLLHHDLNICTNSLQYEMVMDIINNLLLHMEPKKKELIERHQKMRLQLQFASLEEQKLPITNLQNKLRELVSRTRRYEREFFLVQRELEEYSEPDLLARSSDIQRNVEECKEQSNALSEELALMVNCYKEAQLRAQYQRKAARTHKEAPLVRRTEVCFKHAEWRMTEADGQIGIADLVLRNFLYTKLNREDESGSHQLELGWVKVTNLLPNSLYKDILTVQDMQASDKQVMLRIQCQFKAPVGGIAIKEHFEVNVVPLTIALTARFYSAVFAFFFPGKNPEEEDDLGGDDAASTISDDTLSVASAPAAPITDRQMDMQRRTSSRRRRAYYLMRSSMDDFDKMNERAAKNNMFLYVKIPEVPLRVSYKSEKEKHITNIHDFQLTLPTLEYHHQTWTWHDMAMAFKNDSKKALVAQAVKQKLHIKSRALLTETFRSEVPEENKAKLLLGAKLFGGAEKSKKGIFHKSSKSNNS